MPHEQISSREFGQLETKVQHLDDRMERMEQKVDQLLELANKSKGAWRATLAAATGLATLASLLATYLAR